MALLQESGIFNGQTYMARRDVDLSRGLKDFTICAWISLNYLRGTNNYWLSIGNTDNEEILNGGIKYTENLGLYLLIMCIFSMLSQRFLNKWMVHRHIFF